MPSTNPDPSTQSDGSTGADAPRGDRTAVDVTIVLPVYNESGHIAAEVDRITTALDASRYSYELLIIDDGSTDDSPQEIERIASATDAPIRVMSFSRNQGSGSARRIGTDVANGRIVVWTDADMSYPNDRIPDLVDSLEGYDQVVGARTSEEGTHRAFRVPAKWLIRRLAQYLTSTRIPDLNSGLRAFRRDVGRQYTSLLPSGFSCVTTITMAFLANGYSVRYVPIEYSKRAGKSKFHWWRDTKRYLQQVVRLSLSYDPLRIFGPIALTTLAVGVVKLAFDWATRDFALAANTLAILFLGIQLFAIGLIADLVVRLAKRPQIVPPAVRSQSADVDVIELKSRVGQPTSVSRST